MEADPQLRADLAAEYAALTRIVGEYDGRLVTVKGWSVTVTVAGLRPGFQQQHAAAGVLRQPRGQDAAGGAAADDDDVGVCRKCHRPQSSISVNRLDARPLNRPAAACAPGRASPGSDGESRCPRLR